MITSLGKPFNRNPLKTWILLETDSCVERKNRPETVGRWRRMEQQGRVDFTGPGAWQSSDFDPRNHHDEWNNRAALILLDQALGIVPISIHGIIIDFEGRLPWSWEDKLMHASFFCAKSTEKSFHDSWSLIRGTEQSTFPAHAVMPNSSDVERRDRKGNNRTQY